MPEKQTESQSYFDAEMETSRDGQRVEVMIDGYKGVDADVPKTREVMTKDGPKLERVMVRKPAPRPGQMAAKTTAKNNPIAKATARYKLFRSAFQFAPDSDKDERERQMNIAFAEMQIARFTEASELAKARGDAKTAEHYQDKADKHRGAWMRLTGQGV